MPWQRKPRKTPKKSQSKLKKSRLSIKGLWVFVISFAVIGGLLLLVSKAATPPAAPSIYLTPDSQNLNVGDTFTVDVYENSGTNDVNVVEADLSYDTSQLSYISHTDASAFPLSAGNPSGDTGSLSFTRGTCGGCSTQTGTQLVLSVTFKALTAGTAPINVDSSSYLANNGQTEPGLNTAGGNYTIAAPAGSGGGGTGGGGGGSGGGGGGTITPPKTTTTTTHHTTTSPAPSASSAPAPTPSPAPTQTSTSATSSIPATTSTEPPLIPASVMRLLKIAGVAAVLAVSVTIFSWAWGRMRTHIRLAGQHNIGGGVMTMPSMPSSPPKQPAITVKPASQTTPPISVAKTATASVNSDKPEPGTLLKPNSTKSS